MGHSLCLEETRFVYSNWKMIGAGREVTPHLVKVCLNVKLRTQINFLSRLSDLRRCEADDWVLHLKWLASSEKFVIVTAHNVTVLYDSKTCQPLNAVSCSVNCILYPLDSLNFLTKCGLGWQVMYIDILTKFIRYCASITGDCWEEVTILAGTVFQEIVIWKICPPSHLVTHRLTGHDVSVCILFYIFHYIIFWSSFQSSEIIHKFLLLDFCM